MLLFIYLDKVLDIKDGTPGGTENQLLGKINLIEILKKKTIHSVKLFSK
jgi:hypothetical protein